MTGLYTIDGSACASAYDIQGQETNPVYDLSGEEINIDQLDPVERNLLASAKSLISQYDPDGTALKFAFVTDLHRSEEGTYASSEIDDCYSLRLLSRLCHDVDIDAVFCGGDITNGRDENADYVQKCMQDVVSDFQDMLLPYTKVFGTIGNHDKRYSTSRSNVTNGWLHSLWDTIQQSDSGVELHYIEGSETNFYVDFTTHKIRIIFINQYDDVDSDPSWYANENISSATGIHTHGTTAWKSSIPTTNKAEWVVGAVIHGADNTQPTNASVRAWSYTDLSDTLTEYVANGGKGVLGIFAGHYHLTQGISLSAISLSNPAIPVVHVSHAYSVASDIGTVNAYCFSVFVVNSSTGVFHEIRVGRNGRSVPYCTYFGDAANNGLLNNGTASVNSGYSNMYCVYNGNHVRFDDAWMSNGYNFTNLPMEWGYPPSDFVTGDTDNVLFSAEAGDVIKTEVIFSDDTEDVTTPLNFKVFSPQISNMLTCKVTSETTFTNEITLEEDVDVTALGVNYYAGSQPFSHVMDFELNVYKNGVRLVRE